MMNLSTGVEKNTLIIINIKDSHGEATQFSMLPVTKMKHVLNAYALQEREEVSDYRFLYNGIRVNSFDTPRSLGFETGDQIDAHLSIGGELDVKSNDKLIKINITSSLGETSQHQISQDIKMKKLFIVYARENSLRDGNCVGGVSFRFLFNGIKIAPDVTAKMLGLQDGDNIYAYKAVGDPFYVEGNKSITINVIDVFGKIFQHKLKPDSKMEQLMDAYTQRNGGVDSTSFRFLFNGVNIVSDVTAKSLGLKDGDQIDVFLNQPISSVETTQMIEGNKLITVDVQHSKTYNITTFQMNQYDKMEVLFNAYAQKNDVLSTTLILSFRDCEINRGDIAKSLRLKKGEVILVLYEQSHKSLGEMENTSITIYFKYQDVETVQFKIKQDTKMEMVMNAYAHKLGQDVRDLLVLSKSLHKVFPSDTAKGSGIVDGDQFSARFKEKRQQDSEKSEIKKFKW